MNFLPEATIKVITIKSNEAHQREVAEIQSQLLNNTKKLSLTQKVPSNSLHNKYYRENTNRVDVSSLNQILSINPDELWVTVEPRMTVQALAKKTLKYGFIPPVIPEFSSITVGGAIMGAALESSSHKYGQFNDTALEYELILGDGTLIEASPQKNHELFYAISGSYGSLAILTLVKLKLIPAKTYVKLTLSAFNHPNDLLQDLKRPDDELIEGILFSRNMGVAIRGNQSAYSKKIPVFRQNRPWSAWYYQFVFNTMRKGITEFQMPIKEYLFRLDRGAFWMGRYLLSFSHMMQLLLKIRLPSLGRKMIKKYSGKLNLPSFLFRLLFGWAFTSHNLYRYWHRVPSETSENLFFIHDFYTPIEHVEKVVSMFIDKTGIFPIWLCPIKGTLSPQFLSPHYGKNNFINIGLYGIPHTHHSIPRITAELEKEILNFGGRKMLYSFTYYDEELFSKIYENEQYLKLRKKYCAENVFLSLYNKVIKSSI